MIKKTGFLLLSFAILLIIGPSLADSGVDPTAETQGISTSTTIDAVGNFRSSTEMMWTSSDEGGANYAASYTEDTQSNGVGIIKYDKELDIDTGAKISGLWNVEATKQLSYAGINGGRVVSSELIMVSGSGNPTDSGSSVICPFYSDENGNFPAFCNRAEAGSTIDMTIANVRTTSQSRFVTSSGDYPVELNHAILVTEYAPGIPSQGMASAFINSLIHEGRGDSTSLMEQIRFEESTSVIGEITVFEKLMHYESGVVR
jgi:hypothetical protein